MFRRLVPIVVLTAAAAPWVTAAPVLAVGTGDPRIVSPAQGDTVASGFTGPVSVAFTNAPATTYEFDIDCFASSNSDYYWSTTFTYDGSVNTPSWTIPKMVGPADDCEATVYDTATMGSAGYDINYFTVSAPPPPPLSVDRVSQTPETFYPLVHDDYRDSSTTRFRTSAKGHVEVAVTNRDGKVVRHADLHTLRAGSHSWVWNGKRDNGDKANLGTYHVKIVDADTQKTKASSKAVVATGWRTRHDSSRRTGHDYTWADTAGNCHISKVFGTSAEELDCWGGRWAITRYRLSIPANATNVSWHVAGHNAFDDFCCQGFIKRSGKKLDKTHYQVEVKVTGWRAFDVKSAYVNYTYKARI